MDLYNTLELLKIVLFWEIVETQNPLMLDKAWEAGKEYTEDQANTANVVWLDLYDQYFLLEDDAATKAILMDQSKNVYEIGKIQLITENLNFLLYMCNVSSALTEDEFTDMEQRIYSAIKKLEPKMKIEYFEGVEKNIETIQKWIRALTQRYELNNKRNKKDVKRKVRNMYEKAAEISADLQIHIDVFKMNCKEWVAFKKEASRRAAFRTNRVTQSPKTQT